MKKLRLLFSTIILLLFVQRGQTQIQQPSTHLFTTRDGLPDNKVLQFLETQKSPFRWAITSSELCRFDGYRFQTVWEKLPEISGFAENSRGELLLWHLHAGQQLSKFEPESGKKTTRKIAEIAGVRGNLATVWAQDTMIFLTTEVAPNRAFEVYRLFPDFSAAFFYRFDVPNPDLQSKRSLQPTPVFYFEKKNDALWFTGLLLGQPELAYRFDRKTGQTQSFPLPQANQIGGDSDEWLPATNQPLLIRPEENRVWAWNAAAQGFEIAHQKPSPRQGLQCIGADKKGAMIFKKMGKGFDDFWLLRADGSWLDLQNLLPRLKFNAAAGVDFSRQIYFSTLDGVLRVNFERPLFGTFIPEKTPFHEYLNPAMRGITADRDGSVWMMSEMMNLFCLRPNGITEPVQVREKNSGKPILLNNAVNLQTDAQGNFWTARNVASDYNLARIDPKNLLADTFSIKNQRVSTFLILKNGLILLGCYDQKSAKILLLDPATRQVSTLAQSGAGENFKSSPLYFMENEAGKIWVGSNEGLALFDLAARKFVGFAGDGAVAREFPVAAIFQENEKNLWLGTLGGGLRKLDLTTGNWEIFTLRDGLPANKIAGILPDDAGNLWVSTYNGLSFFQTEAKLFTNFFTANGLTSNEFNRFSFFKNPGGRMFFGGLNGVNFFKPNEVLQSFSQGNDSLLISQISWFAPDGKTKIEQVFDLQNLEKIALPPDNRFCSIRLALANYLLPEANRFSWKLEGHDEDWHLNGTSNEITFHYLPAGSYRLRIRAANPTGVWGKNERILEIEVREFWYKTWWAFAAFAAAVCGLFYFFYKNQVRHKLEHAENQRIKELDNLKTRLYQNITHEFRTPLTVILGMTERLTEDGGRLTGAEAKSALGLIHRNGKNLLRLINQLLDLSKLDSGAMKISLVRADVIGYLQYLTESFYSMAQERQVRLVFYPETPSVVMDFDEEKLQVIVFNLISNALKFTEAGGKVVFHAKLVDDVWLQLKIQDTGKGIAPEEVPHIFDRFYQADNSATRKTEGTGIGLALVKELVELLGGRIEVESEVRRGTVFTVILPAKTASGAAVALPKNLSQRVENQFFENAESLPAAAQPSTVDHPPSTDKPLLLLIEDNADVVAYIASILKKDYQIHTAANGKIGIETAFETVPDIIISDVMMPEKDGYEVCDTLKNDERTSHIPIILLTAKATQEDKVAGLRVGADAYLQKPFDKTELLVRLEKLVALRLKLQERYASKTQTVEGFQTLPPFKNSPAAPTLDEIFLQKIRQVIHEKMGDPKLGILHLCRAANLSHTQVFRKLKALTGENPTLLIRRLRLERAMELLKTSDLNVSEIAYEVGFSDPNYFSRSFHEVFGKPPSAIRN